MENIKNNIASNICYYRKKNNYTQASLAEKLGVKATTVSTWERGASLPDAELLFQMCSLFNISIKTLYGEYLFDGITLDENEKQLIEAYRKASDGRKEAVRALLDI